jgi:ABC-type transport system involved in multi-copper enzyme maturation permease subunit
VGLAFATVRRAAIRHGAAVARAPVPRPQQRRPWLEPSLDHNPVLWCEWRRTQPSRWLRIVWSLFWLTALCSSAATTFAPAQSPLPVFLPLVNGAIVTFGLLLFSVSAATSLAEERNRGSLDVLMTTPLSAFAIVQGKWWGTFRSVPLFAALPVLNLVVALVRPARQGLLRSVRIGSTEPDRAVVGVVIAAVALLILTYGAAITSLGLALATWSRRVGRASVGCTVAFVAMTVLPILVSALVFGRRKEEWLLAGSPFWAMAAISDVVARLSRFSYADAFMGSVVLWSAIYGTIAVVLQVATLATFDRCLGRARQRREPMPSEGGVVQHNAAV